MPGCVCKGGRKGGRDGGSERDTFVAIPRTAIVFSIPHFTRRENLKSLRHLEQQPFVPKKRGIFVVDDSFFRFWL